MHYQCPRCGSPTEVDGAERNVNCGDCLLDHTEIVAMVPVPDGRWWNSSSGRIELLLTSEQAHTGHHQGKCDDDVAALARVPGIRKQLDMLKPQTVRDELREYGSWDTDELRDHEQNLQRLLWLACGDLCDQEAMNA